MLVSFAFLSLIETKNIKFSISYNTILIIQNKIKESYLSHTYRQTLTLQSSYGLYNTNETKNENTRRLLGRF